MAIHESQIAEHGGTAGVRDAGLLESALARPQQKHAYADDIDLAGLAAAYAFGIAKNHPFIDGNKRTAFMSAYVFLSINGHEFEAPEPEVVSTVEALASSAIAELDFAAWLRAGSRRRSSPRKK